jgi:uncharacterized protein (TIGR02679 family)
MHDADKLFALLSQDGFRRPVRLALEKIETQGDVSGSIRLPCISQEELRCLTGMLGKRWRPPPPGQDVSSLAIRRLDSALRESRFACTLPEALELISGRPLANRRAARVELRNGRDAIWVGAYDHPAAKESRTTAWLKSARRNGATARLVYANAGESLTVCLDAAVALPAEPPEALGVLASRLRGNAHALDPDTAAGQLLASLLASWGDVPTPTSAAERRALFERNGILTDPISCAVAVLNLPVAGDGLITRLTTVADGHHLSLTLGNLTCERLQMTAAEVFVCENPTVLAEAERRLGRTSPPIVCADGQFNTACLRTLQALSAAGCSSRVHADFDWGGIHIASRMIQTVGVQTWRYDAAAYREAIEQASTTSLSSRPPRELDPHLQPLADAIRVHGRAVHEEAIVESLLDDLAGAMP